MTDMETVKAMLERAGIEHGVEDWEEHTSDIQFPLRHKGTRIRVEDGYAGFYSLMSFDINGALKAVEAYE